MMESTPRDSNSPKEPENNTSGSHDSTTPATSGSTSRRGFLRAAGAGAAGVILGSAVAATPAKAFENFGHANPRKEEGSVRPMVPLATGRVIGANDRINIGHVGIGGRGSDHLVSTNDLRTHSDYNTRSVAVCDCYSKRREAAKAAVLARDPEANTQMYDDYRRLLDNKDVDAVLIATPEHWHAQVAIDAMQAGKHVYIEKPMTRYLNEAFVVNETQKRTGKVVQVGVQGCSDAKWWTTGKAVSEGKIGDRVVAQDSYCRNSTDGEWNYSIDPDANPATTLEWDMWLGSAPMRPWGKDDQGISGPERFFRYRKYRDYSAGLLGDLLPHKMLPLMIAMMYDKPQFPTRVTALGTRSISTDRQVADTLHVIAEFEPGFTMYVLLSTVNEQGVESMIRGHEATLRFGGDHVNLTPERAYSDQIDEQTIPIVGPGEDTNVHRADWFNAIRTGKTPNCNVDLATKAQVVISLAEMSELHNKTICFDPMTQKIVSNRPNEYQVNIPKKA